MDVNEITKSRKKQWLEAKEHALIKKYVVSPTEPRNICKMQHMTKFVSCALNKISESLSVTF